MTLNAGQVGFSGATASAKENIRLELTPAAWGADDGDMLLKAT
jgi:hypothetical protein